MLSIRTNRKQDKYKHWSIGQKLFLLHTQCNKKGCKTKNSVVKRLWINRCRINSSSLLSTSFFQFYQIIIGSIFAAPDSHSSWHSEVSVNRKRWHTKICPPMNELNSYTPILSILSTPPSDNICKDTSGGELIASATHFFFIGNSIFHLSLELLTKFQKTSLKVA